MATAAAKAAGAKGSAKLEAGDDPLLDTPVVTALGREPSGREKDKVQAALDWWLESLPAAGAHLAPELQAPAENLLTAFRKGRLVLAARGQKVQDEGEEVRHYTIVLMGRCRLRCRTPAPKSGGVLGARSGKGDGDDALDEAVGELGFVTCDVVGRGESPGLFPGDSRSPYEVICAERSVLLLLNQEDYGATFQPLHRALQASTLEFLRSHNICPAATPQQLQRLAVTLRHRTYRRGHLLMKAGDSQRNVWILRQGNCAVLATGAEEAIELAKTAGREEVSHSADSEGDEHDSEEEEEERMEMLRQSLLSLRHTGAVVEAQNAAVAKYARGAIKAQLQPPGTQSEQSGGAIFGSYAAAKAGAMAAFYCEGGTLLGEEALLFDGFREQLSAKVVNTVRVEAESSFYVADVTAFRLLSQCLGQEALAEKVGERLGRRGAQFGRGQVAAKKLERMKKYLQKREQQRLDREQVRLPPSSGASGVIELEDVNDFLKVILEHRRHPPNDKNPSTLCVLEGLGIDPFSKCGPGVETMRKIYADQALLKEHQSSLKRGAGGRWRAPSSSSNPMGETVSANARYEDTIPGAPEAAAPELLAASQQPPGGIFFQTEPDLDETQAQVMMTSSSATFNMNGSDKVLMAKSSSVPSLPRLKSGAEEELEDRSTVFEPKKSASIFGGFTRSSGPGASRADFKSASTSRAQPQAQRIMKAFHRAVNGKCVLILTDKAEVRRSVMRAMMSAATEMELCFVKSTSELWQRMRDAKEQYHALIVDLGKSELQVETFVRTIRGHERYGQLPVVVLSDDRELPDLVRQSCSFVVFHPLAASMLREALLWCFDRRAMQAANGYFDMQKPLALTSTSMTDASTMAEASSLSVVATQMVR